VLPARCLSDGFRRGVFELDRRYGLDFGVDLGVGGGPSLAAAAARGEAKSGRLCVLDFGLCLVFVDGGGWRSLWMTAVINQCAAKVKYKKY